MRRDPPGIASFLDGGSPIHDLESPAGPLLFLPLLLVQGGGMDFSRVGEKLLSSVRSARSLGLLPPPPPDRPEVPARAAAAAAVARALAGLPPHQRLNLPTGSEELASIYGTSPQGQTIEKLEDDFYEEIFDPVKYALENIPSDEADAAYFEEKATLRLAQLDKITECLSRHVMDHHEQMVKGMQLVTEMEQDLKVANVICRNGRRYINSSMNEVSRDLVVNSYSKKKQALLDVLPILSELRKALDMQVELEKLVEEGNYFRAFQVLSEYLQLLESYSELSSVQEMGSGIEPWLARTLHKLDSLLLGVCQNFKEENYVTAVDAYALIGDISGLAEKIQSFFMQEVLSGTHLTLKDVVQEDMGNNEQSNRLTYSDLCTQIPESKFRQCLLKTLDTLFKLMCSYYAIMCFQPKEIHSGFQKEQLQSNICAESGILLEQPSEASSSNTEQSGILFEPDQKPQALSLAMDFETCSGLSSGDSTDNTQLYVPNYHRNDANDAADGSNSPFYQLRNDSTVYVAQALHRGKKNLWQLSTSRVSVLLSCPAVSSTSTHQFLRNYEDLNVFILAGEAFCGVEAAEFRHRLKILCENYVASFHRQNIYALKMVLEKEIWVKMSTDALQVINLAGLTGDGAALIVPPMNRSLATSVLHSREIADAVDKNKQKDGFSYWLNMDNPFSVRGTLGSSDPLSSHVPNGSMESNLSSADKFSSYKTCGRSSSGNDTNKNDFTGSNPTLEDENEDLLADFIDEDSQLPSRISKSFLLKNDFSKWNGEDITSQTGSSLCLLRLMDKYARLMQKLEIVNLDFFKGICQLFGIFYNFVYETFVQRDTNHTGKLSSDPQSSRLKLALSKISQDCEQWIRHQSITSACSSPTSTNMSYSQMDVMPTIPSSTILGHAPSISFGLKERCTCAETISVVARVLHKSKAHLQSMLLQNNSNSLEDFYATLVDSVPDLAAHIHRTTARLFLHINGYADKIANAKWEVKELGLEHNGYVDLLLGEYKHYKTRLAHGEISKEVQDLLLEYGVENVAEILTEGLSRVKRCTDEGRVLMSLDLQVLINGLQHFVSINVKPLLQAVETFIKAYYLPETEFVHWARSHPEYSKNQIVGLVNLVANTKGWKRKTRLEVLERIESGV